MKKLLVMLTAMGLALGTALPTIAADPFVSKWGTFKPVTFSGTGDDVVMLPAQVKAGFVASSHDGESNFFVWALDSNLVQADLIANTIGASNDSKAFGLGYGSKKIRAFEVNADGNWTLTVKPLSIAPALPSSGSGGGVFKVSLKSKPIWKTTNQGESNFVVWQNCTNGSTALVANGIGNYSGKKVGLSGSCILTVQSDGSWTVKK